MGGATKSEEILQKSGVLWINIAGEVKVEFLGNETPETLGNRTTRIVRECDAPYLRSILQLVESSINCLVRQRTECRRIKSEPTGF